MSRSNFGNFSYNFELYYFATTIKKHTDCVSQGGTAQGVILSTKIFVH